MAPWLPLIKVVLPYLAPIVSSALPTFTSKKSESADPLLAQQIAELQSAVKNNNDSIKALARAMEESAKANDTAIRQSRRVAIIAVAIAAVSLAVAVAAWFRGGA
jgi:hypothetical protein